MYTIKISGFADEITDNFEEQLISLNRLGIKYIALRSINKKNILDFTFEEFRSDIYPLLLKYNINVSSIGSPIGKVDIQDIDKQDEQIYKMKELIQIMKLLQTRYLRVFSLYTKDHSNSSFQQVKRFYKKLLNSIENTNIILLHENEKEIYGDHAIYCKQLIETLNNPKLRLAFDPANFVQVGDDAIDAFLTLQDHIEYMHLKDALRNTGENVLIGKGDGKISEIIKKILESGYKGFFTLEPHLVDFSYLSSIESDNHKLTNQYTSYNAFQESLSAFIKMLS